MIPIPYVNTKGTFTRSNISIAFNPSTGFLPQAASPAIFSNTLISLYGYATHTISMSFFNIESTGIFGLYMLAVEMSGEMIYIPLYENYNLIQGTTQLLIFSMGLNGTVLQGQVFSNVSFYYTLTADTQIYSFNITSFS